MENPYKTSRRLENLQAAIWWVGGQMDDSFLLSWLLSRGLNRDDSFLDVGCGCLRLSIPIVQYLNTGRYFGVDCSARLLELGQERLAVELIREKKPTFVVDADFRFDQINDGNFDIILVHGVICHMLDDEILRLFCAMRQSLRRKGFVSYIEASQTRYGKKHVEHSRHHVTDLVANAGLCVQWIGDYGHPRGLMMMDLVARRQCESK